MFFRRVDQQESEAAVLQRAANWKEYPALEFLDDKTLGQITQDEGVDFATALLFDRFRKSPRHAEFIQRIDSLRAAPPLSQTTIRAKVIIVPGALYVEHPEMGGDGRIVHQVAESLGYETEMIPTHSFGSVANNASLIRAWFEKRPEDRVILVSLSKGGADLKMALAAPDAARLFGNVIAWINVCGPLNGSRIADWVMANHVRTWFFRMKCFFQRRDFQFITDLCHDKRTPLNSPFHLPSSMKVLSVIGFPLCQHMTTRFARFCHQTLAKQGPNDGTTCLSDVCTWQGEIYPVWGADHYFRPEDVAQSLILALLRYLGEELESSSSPGRAFQLL